MKSLLYYFKNPRDTFGSLLLHCYFLFPTECAFLQAVFRLKMGYKLNLSNPQTYSEKLQWLKLYDRKDIYTTMVDKYAVKEFVASKIGMDYIIPTIGVWEKFDDINFEELPMQFVLKTTHDSGGVVICKDKKNFDVYGARKKLIKSLKHDYYKTSKEWPYKNVPRRIFAEKYMEDKYGELRDYKWFCFDGEPKAFYIASDRTKQNEETKFDFFDTDFNHLPFINGHPNADICPPKPKGFEEMKKLAAKLSKGIPEVRVDFYDINGHIYFGEFTFFHMGGMVPFEPQEWDYKLGSWIKLPKHSAI